MSNGILKEDGEGGLVGFIETMEHSVNVHIKPNQNAKTADAPFFEVFTKARSGNLIKIGAAWEQATKATGEVFYSIMLDDPSFSTTLNVTAFKGKAPYTYDVVWRRPRQQDKAA